MEILQETSSITKKTFLSHVFTMTEESNAEVMNILQYAVFGVFPIVLLNKSIQRFIPEADPDNSSIELLAEIVLQIIIMFVGMILIHRMIIYVPTYSGFKYENINITTVILAFLIIVLSIQTKLGLKVNILFDRLVELWNGPTYENMEGKEKVVTKRPVSKHTPSQADYLDNIPQGIAPQVSTTQPLVQDNEPMYQDSGPIAANGLLGGSFGSNF